MSRGRRRSPGDHGVRRYRAACRLALFRQGRGPGLFSGGQGPPTAGGLRFRRPPGGKLAAPPGTDDAWETPLGNLTLATEFYAPLAKRLTLREESPGDNTIEVQLPLVKYFFPQAKLLALRAPHSDTAIELGQAVAAVAKELKVSILVFGSTDLTHYGPNYGWSPKGYGPEAVKWVKEVNDKKFIDQALKLDGPGMLKTAQADQSACSAGGAVAAVAAAKADGARKAALIDYYTSYDVMPGDSFVGYAGVVLEG